MTDKDREGARRGRLYEWLAPKLSIEERDTLDNLLFCTAEEAARTERERILNAVNILITAWSVDHKDWREFDVGYTSALEQVAGMIRKDLTPESATEPRTCETCDQVFDWIKKNTGWSICDPDTGDVDRNGETYRQLFDIVNRKPHSPQSADVETVRDERDGCL